VQGLGLGHLDYASHGDGRDVLQYISDREENLPSRLLERSELEKLLAEAIECMPQMDRRVISLYYQEDLTLREIAKVVHLHQSRISQLKSQAILRLRTYVGKRWPTERGV
jgi:RNA polymerase sigma factor for flagellar operon FliA